MNISRLCPIHDIEIHFASQKQHHQQTNSRPRQHVNPIDYKQKKKLSLIDSGNRAQLTIIDFHLISLPPEQQKNK